MKSLILLILLSGCGYFQKPDNEPKKSIGERIEEVRQKRLLYCDLASRRVLELKYAVAKCDSNLFTSLHDIACGYPGIEQFERTPGEWRRSPTWDCFDDATKTDTGSDSGYSKDMATGRDLHFSVFSETDLASRVVSFCEDNMVGAGLFCKMCEAETFADEKSKCWYPLDSLNDLRKLIGMNLLEVRRDLVQDDQGEADSIFDKAGFQKHLDVLQTMKKSKIYGGIKDAELDELKKYASENGRNALFTGVLAAFIDGDMNQAIDVVMDESLFPADRLPDNHDNYCTPYLWERDKSPKDWEPCKDKSKVEKDGTDLVIAAWVIEGGLSHRYSTGNSQIYNSGRTWDGSNRVLHRDESISWFDSLASSLGFSIEPKD